MIKISKSVEYTLLALKHIDDSEGKKISSRSISTDLNIPYDLLSKLLQKLVKNNILISEQGKYGGYSLLMPANKLTVLRIINALDENVQLVNCSVENATLEDCSRINSCYIREPFFNLQNKINQMFESLTLKELTN